MQQYTIKKGQKNFRPYELPYPYWKPSGFEVQFKFHPGGWCSLADWDFDRDWYDWQKLAGLTRFFSANNKQSAMYAFRFGEEEETYELAAYLNDSAGQRIVSNPIVIRTGVYAQGFCSFENENHVRFWARQEDESYLNFQHGFRRPKLMRRVGTYPGGRNNSEGPHGGRAVKAMQIELDFKIF